MELSSSLLRVGIALLTVVTTALLSRIFYMQKLHPLSKFPGPWYATSFSIVGAIISIMQKEPEFFMYLVRKYGSKYLMRALTRTSFSCKQPTVRSVYLPHYYCFLGHLRSGTYIGIRVAIRSQHSTAQGRTFAYRAVINKISTDDFFLNIALGLLKFSAL
jgi:hypothetical protein